MVPMPFGKRLRPGEQRAAPGMFRIVVYFGDHMYQIGEDQIALRDAGIMASKQTLDVQVFDDRGEPRLSSGGVR